MGLSYQAVESLLARARRTLRNSLAGTLGFAALWVRGRRPQGRAGRHTPSSGCSTTATLAVLGLALPYALDGGGGATAPRHVGGSRPGSPADRSLPPRPSTGLVTVPFGHFGPSPAGRPVLGDGCGPTALRRPVGWRRRLLAGHPDARGPTHVRLRGSPRCRSVMDLPRRAFRAGRSRGSRPFPASAAFPSPTLSLLPSRSRRPGPCRSCRPGHNRSGGPPSRPRGPSRLKIREDPPEEFARGSSHRRSPKNLPFPATNAGAPETEPAVDTPRLPGRAQGPLPRPTNFRVPRWMAVCKQDVGAVVDG